MPQISIFAAYFILREMIETNREKERAVLIGILYPKQEESEVNEFLEELAFLTETAGAVPVRSFIQKLDTPNPRTFVGTGKIEEIASFVEENRVKLDHLQFDVGYDYKMEGNELAILKSGYYGVF